MNLSNVVRLLKNFDLRTADTPSTRPVNFTSYGQDGVFFVQACGVWFCVSDNGGEVMVEKLNSGEYARAVPCGWGDPGDPCDADVACWVAMALRGEALDLDQTFTAEEAAVLEAC